MLVTAVMCAGTVRSKFVDRSASGTVAVVAVETNRVVIAADSRAILTAESTKTTTVKSWRSARM